MISRHGWKLLFHTGLVEQLCNLHAAVLRAQRQNPAGCRSNANVKLFNALSQLMFELIPSDPTRDAYRQGNTMGAAFRHWRRAKIGRRFRLFFRFDSKSKIIIYAWVNDEHSLRSSGSRTDPYVVFQKMLASGHPPDDWSMLLASSQSDWQATGL